MPSSCRPFCSLNGRPLPQPPTVSSSSGPSGGDQLPDSLWDVPVSSSHQRRQCKPSPYLLKARLCFCPLSLPGPFRATHACILSLSLPLCGLRVAQPPLCREEGVAFMGLFQKCHHIQGAPTRGPLNQHHFHLGRKLAPGPGGQLTGQQSLVSLGCVHHYSNLFSFPNKIAWCKWERRQTKHQSLSNMITHMQIICQTIILSLIGFISGHLSPAPPPPSTYPASSVPRQALTEQGRPLGLSTPQCIQNSRGVYDPCLWIQ